MGLGLDEIEEDYKTGKEIAEKSQEIFSNTENPEELVEEMRNSDEYEGQAFTSSEVKDYLLEKVQEAQDDSPRKQGAESSESNEIVENLRYLEEITNPDINRSIKNRLKNSEGIRKIRADGDAYFLTEDDYEQLEI